MKKTLACLIALLLTLCCVSIGAAEETRYAQVFDTSGDAGQFTIRFLWLGPEVAEDKPGDSMILTSPDGKIMVLDAGHPLAADYVIQALDAMGVTKIDYLVASHPHIDHIGGMPALIERYEIGAVYTSSVVYTTNTYTNFINAIEEKHLEHIILKEGDVFSFGDQVQVEVFNPPAEFEYPKDYPQGSTQFVNNHSLTLKFTYGESTAMLSGDLYTGGELDVVERWGDKLDCDIMKANHHGSGTSSSLKWRNAVSPKITFLTSDTLEDIDVAKKYIKNGQKMYHTFLDGCIRVSTPGDATYEVLTEKDRATTMFD